MPEQHLFLSDVHYGALEGDAARCLHTDLVSLIDHCREQRIRIHLLGDFFDWWMEYPGHHPPFADPVLEHFRHYMEELGPVLYITGNHDNWTREYLESVGFDLEPEQRTLHLDGRSMLLLHGDGLLDPSFELPRPLFHRFLRHPRFVSIYQNLLPPAAGLKLMQWFSERSRRNSQPDPSRLDRWAEDFLEKKAVDFIICGHDHIPRMEIFSDGGYINCGAFIDGRNLLRYTRNGFELVIWDGSARQMTRTDDNEQTTMSMDSKPHMR